MDTLNLHSVREFGVCLAECILVALYELFVHRYPFSAYTVTRKPSAAPQEPVPPSQQTAPAWQ